MHPGQGQDSSLWGNSACYVSDNLIGDNEWPTIRIPKVMAKAGAWAQEKMAGDDQPFNTIGPLNNGPS